MEKFYLFVSKEVFENLPDKIKIVNAQEPSLLERLKKSKRIRYIPALCIKAENYETIIYGKTRISQYLQDLASVERGEEISFDKEILPEKPLLEEPVEVPPKEFPPLEVEGGPPEPTPENIKPVLDEYKKKFEPNFDDY